MTDCAEVKRLLGNLCDLSKYATLNMSEVSKLAVGGKLVPQYHAFSDLRFMVIKHLLRNEPEACFSGDIRVINVWTRQKTGEKDVLKMLAEPGYAFKEPANTKCVNYYNVATENRYLRPEYVKLYEKLDDEDKKNNGDNMLRSLSEVSSAHSTLLEIVPWNHFASFWDSNGSSTYYTPALVEYLTQLLTPFGYELSEPANCPVGFHHLTKEPRCENWSMLMLWLRTKCTEYDDSNFMQDQLLEQGGEYLKKLMQGWTCFMWGYAEISGILEAYFRIKRMPPSAARDSLLARFQEGDLSLLNSSRFKSPFFSV